MPKADGVKLYSSLLGYITVEAPEVNGRSSKRSASNFWFFTCF